MKLGKMEQQESCVDFNHLDVDKELKNQFNLSSYFPGTISNSKIVYFF